MPLSEHEQQMLEQMEQALASEDPRFANQMRGGARLGVRRTRLVVGAVGVLLGLGLVVLGVNTTMWVGALGFAVMVAAAAYAFSPVRTIDADTRAAGGKGARAGKGGRRPGTPKDSSFMDRLDERWERRERGL